MNRFLLNRASPVIFTFGHFVFHLSPDQAMHLITKINTEKKKNITGSPWQDIYIPRPRTMYDMRWDGMNMP
jgi:hypothetical protein